MTVAEKASPRIMLVIHGLRMGGAEMMVKNLACALHEAGYSVEVVSLHDGDTPVADMIREGGVKVIALKKRNGPDLGVILELKREMERFRPTVVHTHLPVLVYVLPAARIYDSNVKIVHTFHSIATKETRSSLIKAVNRRAFLSGDVLPVALNEEVRDSICKVYDLDDSAIPVVRNGVDLKRFRSVSASRTRGDVLRLLCVARFEDVKNHSLLLRALAILVSEFEGAVELTLVGDGPLRPNIESLVNDLGLSNKVVFAGQQKDTAPYYGRADIFVLVSKYEGLPMSVIEAMAAGLPVVATNVGGLPGIVRPGVNGELVGLDAEEAANAIAQLCREPDVYQSYSEGSAATATEFLSERMMEGYLDLYF